MLAVGMALSQSHIGEGHAEDAGLDALGALDDAAEAPLGCAGARVPVAIAAVVDNDDGFRRRI